MRKLTIKLRGYIVKREIIKPVTFEELVITTGGYGVSQVEIGKENPLLEKTLLELNLRKLDISVLVIEREGAAMPNPSADSKILVGDKLTCFGKLEKIRKELCTVPDNA